MKNLSNNSKSTHFVSTALISLPSILLLWIVCNGKIDMKLRLVLLALSLVLLIVNIWLNFLVCCIYYDSENRNLVVKKCGKIVHTTNNLQINIKPMGRYLMAFANFILLVDGKQFRFRSKKANFPLEAWIDRTRAAESVREGIMKEMQ